MKELRKEKGFWIAVLINVIGILAGIPFYDLKLPLETGSFAVYFQAALTSRLLLFLIPIMAVLPMGASYVKESSLGFLKSYIVRISRMDYIKRKTLQIYAGGFLAFFLSGLLSFFLCFLFLFPLELTGSLPLETIQKDFALLLRISLTAGMTAEISGIFAAAFQNYYMAYGLPFVCYYLLIILKERYLPGLYALNPTEWIAAENNWGVQKTGIWFFLLIFSLAAMLLHGLLLYRRLREI